MKNKIILFVLALFLIQNCSAQFNDYKKKYNALLPTLQKSANNKSFIMEKNFLEFYQNFTVKDRIISLVMMVNMIIVRNNIFYVYIFQKQKKQAL